ncbi:unnamed protein product [Victoria cruziana]
MRVLLAGFFVFQDFKDDTCRVLTIYSVPLEVSTAKDSTELWSNQHHPSPIMHSFHQEKNPRISAEDSRVFYLAWATA